MKLLVKKSELVVYKITPYQTCILRRKDVESDVKWEVKLHDREKNRLNDDKTAIR